MYVYMYIYIYVYVVMCAPIRAHGAWCRVYAQGEENYSNNLWYTILDN